MKMQLDLNGPSPPLIIHGLKTLIEDGTVETLPCCDPLRQPSAGTPSGYLDTHHRHHAIGLVIHLSRLVNIATR